MAPGATGGAPATSNNGWTFDRFDDGSAKQLAQERELQKLDKMAHDYQEKLRKVQLELQASLGTAYDPTLAPLQLRVEPNESLSTLQLVRTPNQVMRKIWLAFAALCTEMDVLLREAHDIYYPSLVMYGEVVSNEAIGEGAAQVMMGKSLLFLQDLCNYVKRSYDVVQNLMHQLANLYTPNGRNALGFDVQNLHWTPVFEKLSDLLGVLITLDEIIQFNEHLLPHWKLYKRMIAMISADPAKYDMDPAKLQVIIRMLQKIEGTVLDGVIFQNCIEQKYDVENLVNVTRSPLLAAEVLHNVTVFLTYLDQRIGESNETDQRSRYVGLCGLFVFYYKLFKPNLDKKFFKTLFMVHKKIPVIHLFGNVWWSSADFLEAVVPQLVKVLGKTEVAQSRQATLKKLADTLPTLAAEWYGAVCVWMVRLESDLSNAAKAREIINTRIALLLQGLLYASNISNLVKQTIDLHLISDAPLTKKVVRPLTKLIELVKAIEATFEQNAVFIASSMTFMIQHLTSSIFSVIQTVKARAYGQRASSDKMLDVVTALELMIEMLDGPASIDRLILVELALCNSLQLPVYKPEEIEEVRNLTRKLEALIKLQGRMKQACDCHFIFWNRVLLPTYFAEIYDNPNDAHNLKYMMLAINDTLPLLERAVHNPGAIVREFEEQVETLLEEEGAETRNKQNVVDRLAKDIETDLRLHIHSHLKLDDRNPFKVGLKNRVPFLQVQPLRYFSRTMDVKERVTHYLDSTFYNLTTVALHDWRTYAEMRNLAYEKYGIRMTEVHLPSGTLEQGVDALEIMRNIHVFVTRYNYNLNNQIFVERNSNNKHLNTINIRHIANSIRTHGTGVMNTTVNVTYQFLRKKFRIFSEFLYDDYIKSRLIKEIRYFKDNKEEIKQKYPYERAEKFNKSMRKLGVTSDGLTYLDQFRILITTIGNAMGYIRMVRSGGLHYCSNAINFVPDLSNVAKLEELVERESLSQETTQAARNVDAAVDNLTKTFTSTTDYFQLLVDVFCKEFRDNKNMHLKNFYIIIPALTLNFVEHLLACKDRIDKKRKDNAAFTDDGFAMGLAYILKLLDQNPAFDSLHWFTSANEHYTDEARKMAQTKRRGEEQQSIVLTQKKLSIYRQEFDLLYFSLTGARIFFREEGESFVAATKEKEGDGTAPPAGGPEGMDGAVPAPPA